MKYKGFSTKTNKTIMKLIAAVPMFYKEAQKKT